MIDMKKLRELVDSTEDLSFLTRETITDEYEFIPELAAFVSKCGCCNIPIMFASDERINSSPAALAWLNESF
jgi:hypothetical protein